MADLWNRPAQVEPERVVAEFRFLLAIQIGEEGVGVESVVTDVLPGAAMELLRAAFRGHGDHAARRLAQVSSVVARHDLEFLEGILGRRNEENTATAPVISFCTIDQPVVVIRPLAVEGDGAVLVLSHRGVEIRNGRLRRRVPKPQAG